MSSVHFLFQSGFSDLENLGSEDADCSVVSWKPRKHS